MKEIWRDVLGYELYYQVSNLGRVKSLDKITWMERNNCNRNIKGKVLKQGISNTGYLQVCLCMYNIKSTKTVHKLMAIAFLNHTPNGSKGLIVDHIDNNPLNNNLDNLQLITVRENYFKNKNKGTSKYLGVYLHKSTGKWIVLITINGERRYLGLFKNEYDAHLTYQKELKKLN